MVIHVAPLLSNILVCVGVVFVVTYLKLLYLLLHCVSSLFIGQCVFIYVCYLSQQCAYVFRIKRL